MKSSGGEYSNVPKSELVVLLLVYPASFSLSLSLYMKLEIPKSVILMYPSFPINKFSGFKLYIYYNMILTLDILILIHAISGVPERH